jgi:hypothetical protein
VATRGRGPHRRSFGPMRRNLRRYRDEPSASRCYSDRGGRRSCCRCGSSKEPGDSLLSPHHRFVLSQRLVVVELHQACAILERAAVDERAHETTAGDAPVLLGSPIPIVSPFVSTNNGGAGLLPPLMTESSLRVRVMMLA